MIFRNIAIAAALAVLPANSVFAQSVSGDDGQIEPKDSVSQATGNKVSREADDGEQMAWDDFVNLMADGSDGAEGEGTEMMELLELLEQLHASPLDINTVTADELQTLPFINALKAEDILEYIRKNGAMYSLGELMLVKSLSKTDRDMLRLFFYAGDAHTDTKAASRRLSSPPVSSEALWRSDIPFYTKAGYAKYPASVLAASPNKVYRGDRFHHSLRYMLRSGQHFTAGVQMEKDAGERGVDYVSPYVMVKDLGALQTAVVGNFRVSFGLGLAVNTTSRFSKQMMLGSLGRIDAGIAKHSSFMEYGFMTGGAATVRLGNVQLSAFVSRRKADGTMRSDSLGVSALKTDGMHRTQLERSKRGNLAVSDIGGNVRWGNSSAALSATFVATHLSTPLAPTHNTSSTLYRLYNAHGSDFMNGSVAYQWQTRRLTVCGETAVSHADGLYNPAAAQTEGAQGGLATLHSLQWQPSSRHVFTAVARWYGAKYVSINGKALGENSAVQNEDGLMVGWSGELGQRVCVSAYVDMMYFPWMKYQVSGHSYGVEGHTQLEYKPSRKLSLMLRYRVKSKQRDFAFNTDGGNSITLLYKTTHNLKLQASHALSPRLTLRASAIGTLTQFAGETERGFAVAENLRWHKPRSKAKVDCGLAYFHTDSYNSRVYFYEPTLLYSFGFTSYFDQGMRGTLLATVPFFNDSLYITAKLGCTYYIYKESIGTGLELVNANHKEDLQLQLRWVL